MNTLNLLAQVGLSMPKLLLPARGIDLHKFSVIACDQFSAQPEYWDTTEDIIGDNPSALKIILPEARLGLNQNELIDSVHKTMEQYLNEKILTDCKESLVFVHRRTTSGIRRGLVVSLDLDCYDSSADAKTLVRATEGTIADRLPARTAIRRKAPLEIPHTMVLIDDRENLLMGMLDESLEAFELLYDFTLMQNGGHITGRRVDHPLLLQKIAEILQKLCCQGDGMLYAVGDGNHSLAAAKQYWCEIKETLSLEMREKHPARYSMVELVNLHDPALVFEPIHRLICNADVATFWKEIGFDPLAIPDVEILQPALDAWLKKHPHAILDYIHGENECRTLAKKNDCIAIIFSSFDKNTLFERVRKSGALPRKSFSMGQARDKRYYLECRSIR